MTKVSDRWQADAADTVAQKQMKCMSIRELTLSRLKGILCLKHLWRASLSSSDNDRYFIISKLPESIVDIQQLLESHTRGLFFRKVDYWRHFLYSNMFFSFFKEVLDSEAS
jgi:hypothetical protein